MTPEINAAAHLKNFLDSNSWSSVETLEAKDGAEMQLIANLWGDESLEIALPTDKNELDVLAAVLNNLVLPCSFSAIYHLDKNLLEILYTAYKLQGNQSEVEGRSFEFTLDDEKIQCWFGAATKELLCLAKYAFPRQNSETRYRNIQSFSRYVQEDDKEVRDRLFGNPTSFFVQGPEFDEEHLVKVANNLNFYMSYYDLKSPRVLIHDGALEEEISLTVRYRTGQYPKKIEAKTVDENLLSFWNGAFSGDEILRFMLHFRTVEYASTSHSSDQLRKRVLRSISKPDFRDDLSRSADGILDLINASSSKVMDDYNRFLGTVKDSKRCADHTVLV